MVLGSIHSPAFTLPLMENPGLKTLSEPKLVTSSSGTRLCGVYRLSLDILSNPVEDGGASGEKKE